MMRKVLRYLARIILHFARYFIFPLLAAISILFLIGLVVNLALTFPQVNISLSFVISLLLGLMVALMIFSLKTMFKLTNFLWANRTLRSYLEHRLPKVRLNIPISTRLVLKTYLFWLVVTTASLSFSFLLIAYSDARMNSQSSIYSTNSLIGIAIYLLDKFSEDITSYLSNNSTKPNVKYFEEALKSYQNAIPTFFVINDIKKRVMQTALVLERGSRKEIEEISNILQKLSVSIQKGDNPSVDKQFTEMIKLLEKVQGNKREILKLATVSRKEKVKASLREIADIILHKVVPTLIIAVIILAMYMLLGVKLDFLS
jgi:hypothetical protein